MTTSEAIFYLVKLFMCHAVGDYVLQSDYLANSKDKNWYNLIIHCTLYCVPFAIVFGFNWVILVLFASHILIDSLRVRYKKISLRDDQIYHIAVIVTLYVAIQEGIW